MKLAKKSFSKNHRRSEVGMSFVETVVALGMLMAVATGVMGLSAIALSTTETQGHLAARTAEYAQDKMEQLMALRFCDNATDTTVFPAVSPGGTGLAGCTNLANPIPTATAGGGLNTGAPVAQYVDYVDPSGNPVGAGANWEYVRVWQITVPQGTVGVKQIAVTCQARIGVGNALAEPPKSTIVSIKSYPF